MTELTDEEVGITGTELTEEDVFGAPPSTLDRYKRQAGLAVRHGVEGAMAIPSILATPIQQLMELIPGVETEPPSQTISRLLTELGVPQPETPEERVVGDVSRALSSIIPTAGAGSLLAQKSPFIGEALMARPGLQAVGAGAGAGTAGTMRETGLPPGAQLAGGLVAGVAAPMSLELARQNLMNIMARHQAQPGAAMVSKAFRRDEVPVEEITTRMGQLGPEALPVDVGGPNVQRLAQQAISKPGRAAQVAERVLTERGKQSVQRMVNDLKDSVGTDKNAFRVGKDLISSAKVAAEPLYKEAHRAIVDYNDDMAKLFARPTMMRAWKQGLKKALDDPDWPEDIPINPKALPDEGMPLVAFDQAKRQIDRQIRTALRKEGGSDEVRRLTSIKNQLTDILDQQVPKYAEARKTYSDPAGMVKALDIGKKIMTMDSDEMAFMMEKMPQSERDMLAIGAVKAVTDKLKGATEGQNAARRIASQIVKERIRNAFPDDEAYYNFVRGMEREGIFAETERAVLGGSPTQQRLATGAQTAAEAGIDFAQEGVASFALRAIRNWTSKLTGLNEEQANDVISILFRDTVKGNLSDDTINLLKRAEDSKRVIEQARYIVRSRVGMTEAEIAERQNQQ